MDTVQLIGISGDVKYEAWKKNLLKAIQGLDVEFQLEEINSVAGIIDSKVGVVPALVCNKAILMEQNNHIPDADEMQKTILSHLKKRSSNMKKILVPTDFSETAQNAFNYAKALAEYRNQSLKVAHICHPQTDSLNGVSIPMMEELMNAKSHQLDRFIEANSSTNAKGAVTTDAIDTELCIGFAAEQIIELSTDPEIELIVMGTTGHSNLLERWFGSVSSAVSQKAKCPVLLIPPNSTFKAIDNVLYASNHLSVDDALLEQLMDFTNTFQSALHFIHVKEDGEWEDFSTTEETIMNKLTEKGDPSFSFSMHAISANSVMEGLHQYAEKNNIDLIALANHKRTFFQSILGQSMTKKMVMGSKTPLLVYHVP